MPRRLYIRAMIYTPTFAEQFIACEMCTISIGKPKRRAELLSMQMHSHWLRYYADEMVMKALAHSVLLLMEDNQTLISTQQNSHWTPIATCAALQCYIPLSAITFNTHLTQLETKDTCLCIRNRICLFRGYWTESWMVIPLPDLSDRSVVLKWCTLKRNNV